MKTITALKLIRDIGQFLGDWWKRRSRGKEIKAAKEAHDELGVD